LIGKKIESQHKNMLFQNHGTFRLTFPYCTPRTIVLVTKKLTHVGT